VRPGDQRSSKVRADIPIPQVPYKDRRVRLMPKSAGDLELYQPVHAFMADILDTKVTSRRTCTNGTRWRSIYSTM